MIPEEENDSSSKADSENNEFNSTIQNLEFKVLSTFAKIPTFFQGTDLFPLLSLLVDMFSPPSRRPSLVDEHKEQIKDLLLMEWERSASYSIKVDYNSSVNDEDSFEMKIYKQVLSIYLYLVLFYSNQT